MNLEQLQAKSDKELNRMAAIHILWGGIVNVPSDDWDPTNDMNCAMRLLYTFTGWEIRLELTSNDWSCRLSQGWLMSMVNVEVEDKTLPRSITIASILAKLTGKETSR